jgi:hypothetical protein
MTSDYHDRPYTHDSNSDLWISTTLDWLDRDPGISDEPSFENRFAITRLTPPVEPGWPLSLSDALIEHLENRRPQSEASGANDSVGSPIATFHQRLDLLCTNLVSWLNQYLATIDEGSLAASEMVVAELASRLYALTYNYKIIGCEGPFLQLLSRNQHPAAMRLVSELLVAMPPHDWSAAAIAIGPLMQSTNWEVASVFPKLLEGLQHPTTVAPVLDLANFVFRRKMVDHHPASSHAQQLVSLLGGVATRLGVLEETPQKFGDSVESIQRILGESVALCVSLCDTLSLLDEKSATPKLNQALELRHRRVRTEAAGALAKLGDEHGRQQLLDMAAEPTARMRVLHYAEELGIADDIDEQWRTPAARAAAELALWLSQPQQMGVAPSDMELVDSKTQYWPSYDDPQECFLYRFTYRFPSGDLSNIGIAGPLVLALSPDLGNLPTDDIYAIFAGWQADHPDIFDIQRSEFNDAQLRESERLTKYLESEGHEQISVVMLGFFLGEVALVAKSTFDDVEGIAVCDGIEIIWQPTAGRARPLGPEEVHWLFIGQRMLRSFNA